MQNILLKLAENKKQLNQIEVDNMNLTEALLDQHGAYMEEDKFWALVSKLREKIEDRRTHVGHGCYEQGIHNFFCGNIEGFRTVKEKINFVSTYRKKVLQVSVDAVWDHARKYGYFSDDCWFDFTDFLPLEGREVYDHVITLGGKLMPNGVNPWEAKYEGYIVSNLTQKLTLWASLEFIDNAIDD